MEEAEAPDVVQAAIAVVMVHRTGKDVRMEVRQLTHALLDAGWLRIARGREEG